MPLHDCRCRQCDKVVERIIRLDDIEGWKGQCDCGGVLDRIFPTQAPSVHADANDYHAQIAKMKKASKERFVKKEIDDVRHKHGRGFDDSLVGSAAQRIRDGVSDND